MTGRWDFVMRLGLLGIITVLVVTFAASAPGFLSLQNIDNNARQMAVVGILAVGETFVIITAGIDLAVGSLLGLTGIVVALSMAHGWPIALAILLVVAIALGVGLLNGTLVS